MSVLKLINPLTYLYQLWTERSPLSCLQDDTQKQYRYLFQVFILFMVLKASRIYTSMGIWLPLSDRFNRNVVFLKCQIGCAINLNHIKKEKATEVLKNLLVMERVFQFLPIVSIKRSPTPQGDIAPSFMGGDPF